MKDLNFLLEKPIAHRGYHSQDDITPENSLRSFEEAIKRDLPIEFDVLLTKDHHVIVFHDSNLKRMTGLDKNVNDVTLEEIKELYLNNTTEKIPTLEETLKFVDGRVGLLIELKNFENNFDLEINLLTLLKEYTGEFAIQSFNPLTINYFKENDSSIIRGQLSSNFKGIKMPFKKKFSYKYLLHNRKTKPDFIAYEYNKMPLFVRLFNPLTKLAWTVKTQRDHKKYSKRYNNLICELYPMENI